MGQEDGLRDGGEGLVTTLRPGRRLGLVVDTPG